MGNQLNLEELSSKYINSDINGFPELKNFLSSCAMHPELSLKNNALLYVQTGGKAPRFVCHKGIADYYNFPTDKKIWLLSINNDGRVHFDQSVFYSVPDSDERNAFRPVSIRAVFDRIGYALVSSSDVKDVTPDHDNAEILIPEDMEDTEMRNKLLNVLVDYFWDALKDRGTVIETDDLDFQRTLKPVLIYMAGQLMGLPGLYLPKTCYASLIQNNSGEQVIDSVGITQREYRLEQLMLLYIELDQVIEGRHFTLFETEFFRLSQSNPFYKDGDTWGKQINLDDSCLKPFDAYASYASYLMRYINDELGKINWEHVHIYPCFQYLPINGSKKG